ncbi:MAG: hypothetical protein HYZ75_15715 [Elusimicrobia bacterium]|nr:hypothetical protein [Elusimicrobiota bacterium]
MRPALALVVALCGLAALKASEAALPRDNARSAAAAEKDAMIDASFEYAVPPGWTAEGGEQRLTLLGPRDENTVAALISVRYVAPEDPSHKSADAYLTRLASKPTIPVPGWKSGPAKPLTVAGRKARIVERDTSQFTPPTAREIREVPMKEIHVVVPAAKGFYAIVYYAPRSLDKKARLVFRQFLRTFKPKL